MNGGVKFYILIICFVGFLISAAVAYARLAKPDLPALKDGDLIFQTSTSSQSIPVMVATGSIYSHMGIIKLKSGKAYVVEAAGTVRELPVQQWIARGSLHRVALYRDNQLTDDQRQQMLKAAERYYGQPYDRLFAFDNGAIYCSELIYLAYQSIGLSIGKIEKVGDLHVESIPVRSLIKKRQNKLPVCKGMNSDKCYEAVMDIELVTPISIANDKRLTEIYSNYP